MEATGDLVGVVIKLPTRVKDGHDHFRCRAVLLLVEVCWDAPAVIFHGAALIVVEIDVNPGAIARQGFVDRVIHHLVNHLVKAATIVRVTDVHAWSFANGFQILQHRDVRGCVISGRGRVLRGRNDCFWGHQGSLFKSGRINSGARAGITRRQAGLANLTGIRM